MTESDTARERLAGLIEMYDFSHGQVALKAQVPRSNITKFLKGTRRDMGFSSMAKLARALDVSLDWLAGLPKRDPNELEPDETELLRLYRCLADDDKRIILGSVKLHAHIVGTRE